MQGLNFRKKRKHTGKRTRKGAASFRKDGLRFENEKNGLRFVKEKASRKGVSMGGIFLWAIEILIVCMTAVLLVAAFGQRVSVTGDSMAPVLGNGDVVLVNHFIYNIENPDRGDIIVFQQEGDSHYTIKRVAGLPGETVQIAEGKLLIDGKEIKDSHMSDITYAGTAKEPVKLGADEYFVLGDNHTASDDSRTPGFGNVKKEDIFGNPWFVASPWKHFGLVKN